MLGKAYNIFFLNIIIKRTNSFRFEKKVGDQVAVDEVVMEIETDKTTVGVPAPGSGIIEEIYVADGDTVKSGQQLFKMNITGEAPATKAAPAQAASAPPPPAAAAPPPKAAAPAPPTPAAASAPPPPPPKPSAPAAKIPVAAIRHAQAIEEATVKLPPVDYSKEITGTRTEQRVKMNRMRLKIASRLKEAQNTNAMLTTFNEVDMRYD
jgi:2-oxoglutarate dehydrogenase E2 component (dihydrolipoamide succinyltransferase)